ncbi:indole-3-glycerol phosphate synthase [Bacillus sp. FJAT-27225]|uniref:indole-3-glycerol phosphate synthase TrpC n=1 Tax=Bacillus sp. FJAT-27225 TaxID=1743144 RepID=UPI00080C26B4|nr:indole-3-glycerol phosphate synthase TrpC [Bacillus sp. FJAT-27225]OCA90798.1 indole-3-glycerol phosphate synthase [Bacillus sp. FJAT-27225]
METILTKILKEKEIEVIRLKESRPVVKEERNQKRSFIQQLRNSEQLLIIAEFKRASPSKGVINIELDPAKQARQYELEGAQAISVLTDSPFFQGSFEDLKAVREAVNLPVLCKDFIIDEVQIDFAYEAGANLVLLIVAALEESRLRELYHYARSLGLEVLVEVHDETELAAALRLGADLIGVNNRDLRTFEVKLETTKSLGPIVKEAGAFFISESGIKTAEDAELAAASGADGLLIGESFMKSPALSNSFTAFKVTRKEVARK